MKDVSIKVTPEAYAALLAIKNQSKVPIIHIASEAILNCLPPTITRNTTKK